MCCWCLAQVMLYRSLLLGLADACDAECGSEILALHRLDGKAQLSKEVSHAVHRGVAALLFFACCLRLNP